MCIILFAYKIHPKYNLVLAANRDEYFARPTGRAAFWDDAPDVLAGRDLEQGGTWLGVTREGRFAAVTNYRDPAPLKEDASSRGFLVRDFLLSDESTETYLTRTASLSVSHNGFNLIVGDGNGLFYHSNKVEGIRTLSPGVYGLSNHLLDTSWPKVEKGKKALYEIVRQGAEVVPEAVFEILSDRTKADDDMLPQTGISLEYEQALSSIFISTPAYGTRSSTVLLIGLDDNITFVERTFEMSKPAFDTNFQFQGRTSVVFSRR